METAIVFNKFANEFRYLDQEGDWRPVSQFFWFKPETQRFGSLGSSLVYYMVDCSLWDASNLDDIPHHILYELELQLHRAKLRAANLSEWASRASTKSLLEDLVETRDLVRRLDSIVNFRPKWTESRTDSNANLVFEEWTLDQEGEPVMVASWRAE